MARATHVKAARKAVPESKCGIEGGIKKGDSYYWWQFRFSGKRYSKTPPRRSQLTQSEFYGTIYDIEDEIAELEANDTLPSCVEDIASRLRELGEECDEKRSNMPDALQDSETGNLLEERQQACESAADELEQIDMEEWSADEEQTAEARKEDKEHPEVNEDGESEDEYWQAKLEEVQNVSIDAP